MNDFSNIKTRTDLARILNMPLKKLTHILYIENNLYKNFQIPKNNGGTRDITAPSDDLRIIQKRIYKILEAHLLTHPIHNKKLNVSHGFVRTKSIISNSEVHRNKKYVFNTDIKDFFSSIHFGRVKGFFMQDKRFKMQEHIAVMFAQLVCYKGKLPQGAPTSPIISNLICNILDMRLLKTSKKFKLDYTRYADDLTFSTNNKHFLNNYEKFYGELSQEVIRAGFTINEKKNRLQYKNSQQRVTGLSVNDKVNVTRKFYIQTRAMAYNLYKEDSFTINGKPGTMEQLEGRLSFINQVDKHNNIKEYKELFKQHHLKNKGKTFFKSKPLNAREKEYQKFLFYKHFWNNNYPLLITEGKTDVLYIKAALKKYYKEYPNLVQQKDDGDFHYKLNFLKRSPKMRYFFGIDEDGADTMLNIINYYIPKKLIGLRENTFNYFDFFQNKINREAKMPVILLFDNEKTDKPLHKFINKVSNHQNRVSNHQKISSEKLKNELNKPYPVPQLLLGNIYLMTVPLNSQSEIGEIEDLLDHITNSLEISNRKFNKDGGQNFFGKEILSNYIYKEYKTLDISPLRPILDNIKNLTKK